MQKLCGKAPSILLLDCLYYPTLPSLAWSMALKHTQIELDLITDPAAYLMIENFIRGGSLPFPIDTPRPTTIYYWMTMTPTSPRITSHTWTQTICTVRPRANLCRWETFASSPRRNLSTGPHEYSGRLAYWLHNRLRSPVPRSSPQYAFGLSARAKTSNRHPGNVMSLCQKPRR